MDDDPYNLQRFVTAQAPVFAEVCEELRAGRKRGHWMWFVFPQIIGLGLCVLAVLFVFFLCVVALGCGVFFRKSKGWGTVRRPSSTPFPRARKLKPMQRIRCSGRACANAPDW